MCENRILVFPVNNNYTVALWVICNIHTPYKFANTMYQYSENCIDIIILLYNINTSLLRSLD